MSYEQDSGGFDDLISSRNNQNQPSRFAAPFDEDNPFADVISPLRQQVGNDRVLEDGQQSTIPERGESMHQRIEATPPVSPTSPRTEAVVRQLENTSIAERPEHAERQASITSIISTEDKVSTSPLEGNGPQTIQEDSKPVEEEVPAAAPLSSQPLERPDMNRQPTQETMDRVSLQSGGTATEASVPVTAAAATSTQVQSTARPSSTSGNSFVVPETGVRPTFQVFVGDPQKIGDSISGHIVYTVRTKTNSQAYKRKEFQVLRRYRDFLWLYTALSNGNPGVVVPPVPEKHAIGRFADEFVEGRRAALEKMLNKICAHPMLYGDPDLQLFLESDTFGVEIKSRKEDSKGLMRSLGESLNGPKFVEQDDWFNNRRNAMEGLEAQLRTFLKSIESLAKQRRELGASAAEFAETMITLSTIERNKALSHALTTVGQMQNRIKELQEEQARQDVLSLMNTTDEYLRLIGAVRDAFASRVKTYLAWQQQEKDLRFLKKNYERQRTTGKTHQERLSSMLHEIADGERRVSDAKQDFEDVSKLIKAELDRFDKEKVEDLKAAVEQFIDSMVKGQREVITLWEKTLKDLDAAEASVNGPGRTEVGA